MSGLAVVGDGNLAEIVTVVQTGRASVAGELRRVQGRVSTSVRA